MPFFNSNNIERAIFTAYTTISSASTFVGVMPTLNGSTRWQYPDNHIEISATTHYSIPGTGKRLIKSTVNRFANVYSLDFSNMSLSGSVRFFNTSDYVKPGSTATSLLFAGNSNITGVTLPNTSNRTLSSFSFTSCSLSGQIDTSVFSLTGSNMTLSVGQNSNVDYLLIKDEVRPNTISRFSIDGTKIGIGAYSAATAPVGKIGFNSIVDLTSFKALGGYVTITDGNDSHTNSGITKVLFPTSVSGNNFTRLCLNGLPNYTGSSYNLDLSWAGNKLGGYCVFNNLPQITGVTSFSSVTNALSQLDLGYCDLQGTLDLTPYSRIRTYQSYNNNTGLTSIVFNTATGNSISQFDCSVTGLRNLDLSMFLNMPDYAISTELCPYLTGLTLPNTLIFSAGTYICKLNDCDYKTLNFSGTNLAHPYGTRLNISNNTGLTAFTFPYETVGTSTSSYYDLMTMDGCNLQYIGLENVSGLNDNLGTWQLQNNGMTAAIVNETLVKFDNTGWSGTGCTLNIAGTNAAPDTSSGGFNGVAAKISLTGKSWTVTTS